MAADATPTQPAMTADAIDAFLREPRIGVLGWTTADGGVASSPVWYQWRDGVITIASSSAFDKVRAIRRRPAVSFCVQDPAPPYRYVTLRAHAEVRDDPAASKALDAALAVHYLGPDGAATTSSTYRRR